MPTSQGFVMGPRVQDMALKNAGARDFQTALIGMMGHDLRQSLQVIQGTYSMLRTQVDERPREAWLDRGERAVMKLTEQFNCLLDAFYLAERGTDLQFATVSLNTLFVRLLHENDEAALQRGIDLRIVPTSRSVVSNPVALTCVLRNLMTNAIRYTEPGGRILLGCRREGSEIRIDVYDTGIGIDPEKLPKIFDSFTRLTPDRSEGLGIGLSIVRRALGVLGHRLEVRSAVGQGSLFSIYAPAAVT
ncbi:sensor histidine kinase [Tardiphaga robiniae]|uniref:histidine kinase n=1 Tax=Tardiphaga robiniae TaxID=943830 RepID=A0A7G6TU10_9BRAD|nr:HAMP domain-containing sensor histidine kinase [Tardiphaga robiniae]QND70242.1 HAMP domain-containing histidine kinase [Tardiphaga robiniae]